MDNPERTVERTVRWLKTKKSLPKGTRKATSEKTLCVYSNSKKYKSQVLLNFKKEGKTMSRDKFLTDEQVEIEIERLLNSEDVALAKKEIRIKNKRRQYMYSLRTMEKRGKELSKQGITLENIEEELFGGETPEIEE